MNIWYELAVVIICKYLYSYLVRSYLKKLTYQILQNIDFFSIFIQKFKILKCHAFIYSVYNLRYFLKYDGNHWSRIRCYR